jgi:cystathionine beta-lyase/cystathionine gamma-synthase
MLRPVTKLMLLETPTNPTLKIFDIKAIEDACNCSNAIFFVDNNLASAIAQSPLQLGGDVVMHSVTKYIVGHSYIIVGYTIPNSKELRDIIYFVLKRMGIGMYAFDSWLAHRSLNTLEVLLTRAV